MSRSAKITTLVIQYYEANDIEASLYEDGIEIRKVYVNRYINPILFPMHLSKLESLIYLIRQYLPGYNMAERAMHGSQPT